MSWQAQTAVNRQSKQTNMSVFRLLLYFADRADENGRIDPAPSQSTLADAYNVTTRTIRNRINALVESGELVQTRIGSGPGTSSAYQINLEMPGKDSGNGGRMAETNAAIISTIAEQMAEIKVEIEALKEEILALKVEKVETKGGKGGNERRKTHSTKSAHDPILDPSLIQDNPDKDPPNPPTGGNEGEAAELHAAWAEILHLIAIFEQASGRKMPPRRTEKQEQRFSDEWVRPLWDMRQRLNGQTEEHIKATVAEMDRRQLTIASPSSIESTFFSLLRQRETAVSPPPQTESAAEKAARIRQMAGVS